MLESTSYLIWSLAEDRLQLQAGLCCRYWTIDGDFHLEVVSALHIPISPLNGAQNADVANVVKACIPIGKSHEHNIDNWALSNNLKKLNGKLHKASIAIFCTNRIGSDDYCILGFPKGNVRKNEFSAANGICKTLSEVAHADRKATSLDDHIQTMSLYIREVGHDLAGSIQSIVGKLAYISDGRLTEAAMKTKARDAWLEIQNAHSVAECLGIAVDGAYGASNTELVRLEEILLEIQQEQELDARKRNIAIKLKDTFGIKVDVMRLHFKLAIANLVKNAVKYSFPDTIIEVAVARDEDRIWISVANAGIDLPTGDQRLRLYDFGVRGEKAKDMNVNGSGIGLFTCRKIIRQHEGLTWNEVKEGITYFHASLPLNRVVFPKRTVNI